MAAVLAIGGAGGVGVGALMQNVPGLALAAPAVLVLGLIARWGLGERGPAALASATIAASPAAFLAAQIAVPSPVDTFFRCGTGDVGAAIILATAATSFTCLGAVIGTFAARRWPKRTAWSARKLAVAIALVTTSLVAWAGVDAVSHPPPTRYASDFPIVSRLDAPEFREIDTVHHLICGDWRTISSLAADLPIQERICGGPSAELKIGAFETGFYQDLTIHDDRKAGIWVVRTSRRALAAIEQSNHEVIDVRLQRVVDSLCPPHEWITLGASCLALALVVVIRSRMQRSRRTAPPASQSTQNHDPLVLTLLVIGLVPMLASLGRGLL